MRRLVASTSLILLLSGCGPRQEQPQPESTPSLTPEATPSTREQLWKAMQAEKAHPSSYLYSMFEDCEDDPQPVCIQWDEGIYKAVTDWTPYTFNALTECPTEDGGPTLPCVWDSRVHGNKEGKVTLLVFTPTEMFD